MVVELVWIGGIEFEGRAVEGELLSSVSAVEFKEGVVDRVGAGVARVAR